MTDMNPDVQELLDELELPYRAELPGEGRPDLEAWLADKIRLIGYWQAQIADLEATAKKQIEDIRAFYARKAEQRQQAIAFMQNSMSPTVARMIEGHKKKSVSTPHGLAGFRARKPSVSWPDNILATIKAREIPAVRIEEKPDLAWMRKHMDFNANGNVVISFTGEVDGLERDIVLEDVPVEKGGEDFYVRANGGEQQ